MRLSFGFAFSLFVVGALGIVPAPAQDKTGKNLLTALEGSLQEIIKNTEPSVACVLVSRNDVYRKEYGDQPPPDQPFKLGAFDPAGKQGPQSNMPQWRGGRRGFNAPVDQVGARRFDLSYSGYIPEAYGSGLVIDGERLLILTTYHVIRDATKIYVRLPGDKGSYADIQATDPQRDLAVLVLIDKSIKPLKAIKFGDGGAVKKGQLVVAIANPFAAGFHDGSPSASLGIVSNLQRRAAARTSDADGIPRDEFSPPQTFTIGDYIRTDAQILAGSSGGALVNLNGEVIGLISARAGLTGLEGNGGYAMPITRDTRRMIGQLSEGKEVEHGYVGVDRDRDSKPMGGALVGDVIHGGPAQLAGITSRDCIVAVNGTPIRDYEDLLQAINAQPAGSEARLELRDRRPPIVVVKLAKTYVPGFIASKRPSPVRGIRVDFASIAVLQKTLDQQRNTPFPSRGVAVTEVAAGSPAENAHVSVGSIVTEVNGERVDDPAEFYKETAKAPAGKPIVLTLATDWNRGPQKIVVP